jgi:hypothetical protein
VTRLLDGRHHLEPFAMEYTGEVDYLITWRDEFVRDQWEPGIAIVVRNVIFGRPYAVWPHRVVADDGDDGDELAVSLRPGTNGIAVGELDATRAFADLSPVVEGAAGAAQL